MNVSKLSVQGLQNRIRTLQDCIENAEEQGIGDEVPLLRTELLFAQGEAYRRTDVAVAANGHLMIYRLSSRTALPIQGSAVCHPDCGACKLG